MGTSSSVGKDLCRIKVRLLVVAVALRRGSVLRMKALKKLINVGSVSVKINSANIMRSMVNLEPTLNLFLLQYANRTQELF